MFNNLRSKKLIFLTTSVLTLITATKATAQIIGEITIDPYNDSGSKTIPIQSNSVQLNQESQIGEVTEKVYVNAPATPQRPQEINGDLTSSNQYLPSIPPVNEPYSKQQTSNKDLVTNQNNTNNSLSVSVSPFDVTPTDDNSLFVNQRQNNRTRVINVSPNQQGRQIQIQTQTQNQQQITTNQIEIVSPNRNTNTRTPINNQNQNRRLSLKEALANSKGTNSGINYSVPNQNTRNSSLVSSLGNQKVYKVLVKVRGEADKEQIKSLFPEAFSKTIRGESFLQIGIFSSQENVDKVSRDLDTLGFKAIVNPK